MIESHFDTYSPFASYDKSNKIPIVNTNCIAVLIFAEIDVFIGLSTLSAYTRNNVMRTSLAMMIAIIHASII